MNNCVEMHLCVENRPERTSERISRQVILGSPVTRDRLALGEALRTRSPIHYSFALSLPALRYSFASLPCARRSSLMEHNR